MPELRPGTVVTVSSSVMVPVALPSASVAPTGLDSVTVNVSCCSAAASPMTSTCTSCVVTPGANVTVPVVAV